VQHKCIFNILGSIIAALYSRTNDRFSAVFTIQKIFYQLLIEKVQKIIFVMVKKILNQKIPVAVFDCHFSLWRRIFAKFTTKFY
jgi:hypothetical protein